MLSVGIADIGLHHGPVDAQRAAAGDARGLCERHHPVVERGHGRRPDQVGPADERGVVGHGLEVHPAALPQHQAIGHEVFRLFVTPAVEPLDDEQAEDDFDRGGMPPARGGLRAAFGEIRPHALIEGVVVQQRVELRQDRVERQPGGRHQREKILRGVAIT